MSIKRKARVALIYDFDGTLSPGNMQEYNFFPKLGIKPKQFWREAKERAQKHEADEILSYMTLMLESCTPSSGVPITKSAFAEYGSKVELFPGVEGWFPRINKFAKENDLMPHHFIISSGIREMIEGTPLKKEFIKIFASSFIYDQHEVAIAPGLAINYTTKTQFLFRINKGVLNVWDNTKINEYVPKDKRQIPFSQMIFIGDGSTDVPCMKLTKDQGGHSIAVYQSRTRQKSKAERLLKEERVNYVAPADYSEGKPLDVFVKAVIRKIAADFNVSRLCMTKHAHGKKQYTAEADLEQQGELAQAEAANSEQRLGEAEPRKVQVEG